MAQRFEESYMKQVYEWCDKRGLRTTGHILYENDLGYQTRVCGAAMPQLRYLHNPGIDLLGAQTDEYLTVKQCASVAHQYERSMTISEAYGCTGWELDFLLRNGWETGSSRLELRDVVSILPCIPLLAAGRGTIRRFSTIRIPGGMTMIRWRIILVVWRCVFLRVSRCGRC